MKFGDAVKRSITSFLDGKLPTKMIEETGEEIIYTPEYFEELEAELEVEPTEE